MLQRSLEFTQYLPVGYTERLAQAVEGLRARLGLPINIRQAGVAPEDFLPRLDALAEQAFDDQCTGCNPRYPLISEIRSLYLDAFQESSLALRAAASAAGPAPIPASR